MSDLSPHSSTNADAPTQAHAPTARDNRRVALMSGAAAAGMLALAFASKPLYDTFCRVTGFGGTTQVAGEASTMMLDRPISVRFDSNVDRRIPLRFAPTETARTLRVGENALTFYNVTNIGDEPVRAVASYNVAPFKAGPYFTKLQCFCFEDQVFQPGETVEMAVVFYVDPTIADNSHLDDVREITLSYTFFESLEEAGEAYAAAVDAGLSAES